MLTLAEKFGNFTEIVTLVEVYDVYKPFIKNGKEFTRETQREVLIEFKDNSLVFLKFEATTYEFICLKNIEEVLDLDPEKVNKSFPLILSKIGKTLHMLLDSTVYFNS